MVGLSRMLVPSVPGKGGGRRKGAGRKPTYTRLRVPVSSGRFPVAIPIEAIGQAQRLLLVYLGDVGDVVAVAVAVLAAMPDLRAALPWLEEARAMCFDPTAQQGLDQLIAAMYAAEEKPE